MYCLQLICFHALQTLLNCVMPQLISYYTHSCVTGKQMRRAVGMSPNIADDVGEAGAESRAGGEKSDYCTREAEGVV